MIAAVLGFVHALSLVLSELWRFLAACGGIVVAGAIGWLAVLAITALIDWVIRIVGDR